MKTRDKKSEPPNPGSSYMLARPRLRLRVTAAAQRQIRSGHPWLFADSVREQNREGQLGELAALYDRHDRFLAIGLFDPDSPLRVRVLHAGKPQTIDRGWWGARLEQALARRRGLFDEQTTGYRWINGESDGWPGLVLDRYDATLVLKLYTGAWLARLDEILILFLSVLPACGRQMQSAEPSTSSTRSPDSGCQRDAGSTMVLRLSRNIQEIAGRRFGLVDGQVLCGEKPNGPAVFLETGLRFEADTLRGQKTGFFLDQRENRRRVESLGRGRDVLNAFSFTGGFSVYAARGGARSVTDLDVSKHALAGARRNFAFNKHVREVAACGHETIQADAFAWLAEGPRRQFDTIVLDPPSLAKRETEGPGALQAYARLTQSAIKRLQRGGILVAASCSAHVPAEEFFTAVRRAAKQSGRKFEVSLTTGHPPDHPATFKEAEYLKCIYLQFDR